MGRRWGASEPGSPLGSGRVKAASLLSPTGQLPHHQRPALHAERPRCHHLAVHPPPAASKTALSSPSPETGSRGALTAPPAPSPGVSQTSSWECLLSFPVSCPLPPAILFTHGGPRAGEGQPCPPSFFPLPAPLGASAGLALFQVNGVLPILPLLFPVLWVLATACGEARVLAQMSKASPSSLVSCSQASGRGWGTQKEPKTGTDRVGCAPSKEGRSAAAPPPALRPSTQPALGSSLRALPSLASRVSKPGPRDGRVCIHPCSQQTGVPGLPGVLH